MNENDFVLTVSWLGHGALHLQYGNKDVGLLSLLFSLAIFMFSWFKEDSD